MVLDNICFSLVFLENRIWGKGLCIRILFRNVVLGNKSKEVGSGGGRV